MITTNQQEQILRASEKAKDWEMEGWTQGMNAREVAGEAWQAEDAFTATHDVQGCVSIPEKCALSGTPRRHSIKLPGEKCARGDSWPQGLCLGMSKMLNRGYQTMSSPKI